MNNKPERFDIGQREISGGYEFHISRHVRDKYKFDQAIYSISGNAIFVDFHAARLFTQKINAKRDLVSYPEQAAKAGQINAMGFIDEILHLVMGLYREIENPDVMDEGLNWLTERFGNEKLDITLMRFVEQFPPIRVVNSEISIEDYIEDQTNNVPNRQIILEELLLLWLSNVNSAFTPYLELFNDSSLESQTNYLEIIITLHEFFEEQPVFGPKNQNIINMLRDPAIVVPYSLPGQLEFIQTHWASLLGNRVFRLLSSLDLIREESKITFGGPGPSETIDYKDTISEGESENYSLDMDWMPQLVLLAKNTHVWLHQLSKKYGYEISRLDQIPNTELELLRKWGVTGLWLIGIWERSHASKEIKQRLGNVNAVASAYSIHEYVIASDLGGEDALENLKKRALKQGIRVASDMVPNHMGIDSKWVVEHPDWFIQLDYSPFPSYSFDGPNLSQDSRANIYIEDHYYDKSDAAVVFKWVDNHTNDTRYIYHGNDGTNMPWNDTAQLNFLLPEVREAVIQIIVQVAKRFPIIRFDAAMTLAKKHFHRLWYPEPGTGGAIPTRTDFGILKSEFDSLFSTEFWRIVVDRVAEEVPDTLLLAEAFWLMEGFFVRTLGMHRVYNSAFMNMLRDEDNAKYRSVMKNTLEFDPQILKRFVNFMNNPDEETAVAQFGKENKYFGVCTMMVTMPGLPMFGHGQIEGFSEKYGMEYRKALWDEREDIYLISLHDRLIFPLLQKRYLFSQVENFLLYDFYTEHGKVNEDVFAYSNRIGDERTLVVYHNKYSDTSGYIRRSVAYSVKMDQLGNRNLVQTDLGEGLELKDEEDFFCIFRDHVSGLEYIRSNRDVFEKGLYIELDAYKVHVFLDFREVQDNSLHQYTQLTAFLNGGGVPSIKDTMHQVVLHNIHHPFSELVNVDVFNKILDLRVKKSTDRLNNELITELEKKLQNLLQQVKAFTGGKGNDKAIASDVVQRVKSLLNFPITLEHRMVKEEFYIEEMLHQISSRLETSVYEWSILICWIFSYQLGRILNEEDFSNVSSSWLFEWQLAKIISLSLQEQGLTEDDSSVAIEIINLLINHHEWHGVFDFEKDFSIQVLMSWLNDPSVQRFIQVNRYKDILWFNKEAFEDFMWWMFVIAAFIISVTLEGNENQIPNKIFKIYDFIQALLHFSKESEYQVEKMVNLVRARNLT
jgi:hypothetical protein